MAKRMTLIPADMLGQLQGMSLLNHMSALDNDVNRILQDKHLSTDVKFKHYQDALQRYQMGAQPRTTPPIHTEPEKEYPKDLPIFPTQQLLANIPKQKQRTAKMLAEFIENIPELSLTAKNEIRIDNETVPNSNIVDLFGDLTRDHKGGPVPRGYQKFTDLLNAHNIPLEAIGNRKRRESIAERGEGPETPPRKRQPSESGRRKKRQPDLMELEEDMPTDLSRRKAEVFRRRRMQPVPIEEEEEETPRKSKRLQQRGALQWTTV